MGNNFLKPVIKYSADYSEYSLLNRIFGRVFNYSEYSISKPNIRPSIPIIQFLFFSLRKNMPIIPNIRFLNWIFGRVFRLFSKKKHADYSDYYKYSVSKPIIRPTDPIILKLFYFNYNFSPMILKAYFRTPNLFFIFNLLFLEDHLRGKIDRERFFRARGRSPRRGLLNKVKKLRNLKLGRIRLMEKNIKDFS